MGLALANNSMTAVIAAGFNRNILCRMLAGHRSHASYSTVNDLVSCATDEPCFTRILTS